MQWQDKGIVVSVKKYGENSLILNLFTGIMNYLRYQY